MSGATDRIIGALRETYPGVVVEWERQKADGNEDWPDFQTESGLMWWLDSEVTQTEQFIAGDETGRELALQEYCLAALKHLRGIVHTSDQ